MTPPEDILETGETKVLKDSDNKRRIELWTNGEWIKIGRNIEDPDLCLTFKSEDEYYNTFRRNEHPISVHIENEFGVRNRYIVDRKGSGDFRFYKGQNLILQVLDHELSAIRSAYSFAREYKQQEYDWEDIAKEHINKLTPVPNKFTTRDFDFVEDTKSAHVELIEKDPTVRKVDDKLISNIKEDEAAIWNGAHYDDSNEENPFYYKLTIRTTQLTE